MAHFFLNFQKNSNEKLNFILFISMYCSYNHSVRLKISYQSINISKNISFWSFHNWDLVYSLSNKNYDIMKWKLTIIILVNFLNKNCCYIIWNLGILFCQDQIMFFYGFVYHGQIGWKLKKISIDVSERVIQKKIGKFVKKC